MTDKNWKSIYKERPKNGALCNSRISGKEGYASNTIYCADTATFRTFRDHTNRLEIIVWKHDEWQYA